MSNRHYGIHRPGGGLQYWMVLYPPSAARGVIKPAVVGGACMVALQDMLNTVSLAVLAAKGRKNDEIVCPIIIF